MLCICFNFFDDKTDVNCEKVKYKLADWTYIKYADWLTPVNCAEQMKILCLEKKITNLKIFKICTPNR